MEADDTERQFSETLAMAVEPGAYHYFTAFLVLTADYIGGERWTKYTAYSYNPILNTRISSICLPLSGSGDPPLDSEKGWTGELWLNRVLLILEN